MADKALVDRIVAAKKKLTDDDRDWLTALTDEQAEKIAASCCAASAGGEGGDKPAGGGEPPPEKAPEKAPERETPTASAAPTAAEKLKPKTEAEWLAEAPTPETREMYSAMRAKWDAETDQLANDIVAAKPDLFTAAELKAKPRAELEKIHALAMATKPASFEGRGLSARDTTVSASAKREAPHSPGWKFGTGAAA